MKNIGKVSLLFLCLFINGCIAALPMAILALKATYTGVAAISIGASGYEYAKIAAQRRKQAKKEYPNVDFDKKWPDCLVFDIDYERTYSLTCQVISALKKQIEKEDRQSGLIETKQTPIEIKHDKEPATNIILFQKDIIIITKKDEQSTEVCVKVICSKIVDGKESEYDDLEWYADFKAIFFTKLHELLKETDKTIEK